jgi:hypothetical protein
MYRFLKLSCQTQQSTVDNGTNNSIKSIGQQNKK